MRKIRFASLTVLLILGLTSPPARAVNKGEVDTHNRFANVGAYVVITKLGMPLEGLPAFSSGTLIHPRVMLTAGHLIDLGQRLNAAGEFDLDDVRISFGPDASDPASWLEVEAIVLHPDFRIGNAITENDVGLVILKEPVQGIEPVRLAPVGFLDELKKSGLLRDGRELTVVGYGNGLLFPPAEDIITDGLRRFAQAIYGGFNGTWLTLLQNPKAHEGGTNQGDSGGPTFWVDPTTGDLTEVALASRAIDVGFARLQRIDLQSVHDFIDAVLAEVDAEGD